MDQLTQEQFMARLTHACRYDKLIKPHTEFPLNISIQMDLRHIEAIEQLVIKPFTRQTKHNQRFFPHPAI